MNTMDNAQKFHPLKISYVTIPRVIGSHVPLRRQNLNSKYTQKGMADIATHWVQSYDAMIYYLVKFKPKYSTSKTTGLKGQNY